MNEDDYWSQQGESIIYLVSLKNGGRRLTLIEPLVVVRKYTNSWGKRQIDLKEVYDLRFKTGLLLRELTARLGISRSTLTCDLKKAEAMNGRFDSKVHGDRNDDGSGTDVDPSGGLDGCISEDSILDIERSYRHPKLGQSVDF